jgi:prolyl-tRNA synthetase
MTHEEIMTWLAAKELRSYRDLPQVWYQIQTKLRDEARPRSGLLRTREFLMKDSYSFDVDEKALEKNYALHSQAYHRIFTRCGLRYYEVESDPGMMGGATAHEFMAPSDAGEDDIVICDSCGYLANVEVAKSLSSRSEEAAWAFEEVPTPQKKTVKDVSEFLGLKPSMFIKSLLFLTEGGPVLALLRGDQELHEKKLAKAVGRHRQATRDEVLAFLGVEAGFIGPMGHNVRIVADPSLKTGVYVSGANRLDYHVKGISADLHFTTAEWYDLHVALPGDPCHSCGSSLRGEKVIEVGNIFKLGTKYSVPLHAVYLDREGNERPIVMGSYGIGPARIASAAVEQNHDKDGIVWPKSIAPFDVEVVPVNMSDAKTVEIAGMLYQGLRGAGLDVLMDDRDERPGVKFKDADLVGAPLQVVVGERSLKEGVIELKKRRNREMTKLPVEAAVSRTREVFDEIS